MHSSDLKGACGKDENISSVSSSPDIPRLPLDVTSGAESSLKASPTELGQRPFLRQRRVTDFGAYSLVSFHQHQIPAYQGAEMKGVPVIKVRTRPELDIHMTVHVSRSPKSQIRVATNISTTASGLARTFRERSRVRYGSQKYITTQ